MPNKSGSVIGKAVPVVFTSLLAPVLVGYSLHTMKGNKAPEKSEPKVIADIAHQAILSEAPVSPMSEPSHQAAPPPAISTGSVAATIKITSHGCASTEEEAIQQALRGALRQAAAAELGAGAWTTQGQALCTKVAQQGRALIVSWQEIGSKKEWRLRGPLYHRQLAVEIDRKTLLTSIEHASTSPMSLR